jgi:hypothetical protein
MATRKITVTVPAEIADKLDHLPNRSAFVTQAVQDKLCCRCRFTSSKS